ncbi:CD226 antigen isoform X2 [Trachemys scripta elegans]|uniref:CD226 antigen isoform X2 n=1 Tax=Trachemys scripta elegans TaxID=31138 RepID=UPI001556DE8B|nr:CD226 antigen isoform X2 [Trachemys scripta elegans]
MDYLACLIVVLQLSETTGEGRFVDATVKLTNNMNLECVYPKTDGMTQMSWVKSITTGKETIAVSHPLYGVHIEDKYKDRVRFINTSSRDKSLNFMKTTEADMGFYLCSITFPDGVWEKVVEVIQSDSFEVSVPPTNHTIIEPGGNVTLRCPYSVGSLVQQVMWERIKADRMDTIVLCNLSEGKTYGSDYQERAMIDCATQESDILVIQNVTSSDSGIYRCRYGGNKTHVMSLTVTSEITPCTSSQNQEEYKQTTLDHHWHILLIAGGAAASLLLLVTILIISITAVYRKKKKRRRIMKVLSKALYSTQTRPSNSYGRSNFCGAQNNRRGVASVSGAMDEIYINYRDFSRKPKTRA